MALSVRYCGVCTFPPEYCEYGSTLDKCKRWLMKHDENLYNKLYVTDDVAEQLQNASISPDDDDKKKKRGKTLKMPKSHKIGEGGHIRIQRVQRQKRKFVTTIVGMASFQIDLKKAAKGMACRFGSGASVTGEDEIVIQGDVEDELLEYILECFPDVPEDSIVFAELKKGKR